MKQLIRIAAVASILFATASAEETPVLAVNFDLALIVGETNYSARSKAMVHSGHVIPIELGNFKVALEVSGGPDGRFTIKLPIFERTDNAWYQINVPAPMYHGDLAAPIEIAWESADLKLDLTLIVGLVEN